MKTPALLSAKNLTKVFDSVVALQDITVSFAQGISYALMGVSGSGKSTLLSLLAGLDTPTSGLILYNNRSLAVFSSVERQQFLASTLGLVLQKPHLLQELTVLENVMIKGLIQGLSYKQAAERAHELLVQLSISDKAYSMPATLSGGQQQRVALARALFTSPAFLLADEPTAHVDSQTKHAILSFLLAYCATHSVGLIISTHDHEVASALDHVLCITNGQLQAHPSASESTYYQQPTVL